MNCKLLFLALVFIALAVSITAQPTLAQGSLNWHADYFDNPNLSGTPTVTRQESAVAFDWGYSSPAIGIGSDNFSARWGTDVNLPASNYRFYARADDYVRVIIDFSPVPLIDTFNKPLVGQIVQADITLTAGSHHIQVDYSEGSGAAYVFVAFADLATNPTGPNFATPLNVPVSGGPWTAQYFANDTLAGSPTLIQTEAAVQHDWGNGSPVPSIPADYWSARWTSNLTLNAGTYLIEAYVDDGVRVYVDGTLVLDQWTGIPDRTYSTTLNLIAGQHSFQVDYREATSAAFLDFRITQIVATPLPPAPAPVVGTPINTGVTATVTGAFRLNVRNAPDPVNGAIVTRINRNETFPVTGRNPEGTWYQINVNGVLGWVNGAYVTVSNPAIVPVVSTAPVQAQQATVSTGIVVTATPFVVNIRGGAGTNFPVLGKIPVNGTAAVVGRNASNTWWQVNYNGIVGWVTAEYTRMQANADINSIPVTG